MAVNNTFSVMNADKPTYPGHDYQAFILDIYKE
jgi:hypothetical protein